MPSESTHISCLSDEVDCQKAIASVREVFFRTSPYGRGLKGVDREGLLIRSSPPAPQTLYSGATGRGRPLPLARDPGVSLVFLCFSMFFHVFPCVSEFLREFRVCVSLLFGGASEGFQSLCFS